MTPKFNVGDRVVLTRLASSGNPYNAEKYKGTIEDLSGFDRLGFIYQFRHDGRGGKVWEVYESDLRKLIKKIKTQVNQQDLELKYAAGRVASVEVYSKTLEAKLKIAVEALEKYANSDVDVEYGYIVESKDAAYDALAKIETATSNCIKNGRARWSRPGLCEI